MYTYKSRVRYSEIGVNGNLTLESLVDYFQDCSTFHSEDIGLGIEYLQERHMVWLMSSWQIVIERYPRLCENIIIGTDLSDAETSGWRRRKENALPMPTPYGA